jgi:quercetin dioxygenase-like cupin family protein
MRNVSAPLAGEQPPLAASATSARDVMKYGLEQWTVLAENDQVRVLRFAPKKGAATPIHSHPATVVYVVKGGWVRIITPDGRSQDKEYRSGTAFVRAAETHSDEALDDLDCVLVELKK